MPRSVYSRRPTILHALGSKLHSQSPETVSEIRSRSARCRIPHPRALAGSPPFGVSSLAVIVGHDPSAVFADRTRRTLIAVCDGPDPV
jgi:hypothetical protein